MALERSSTRDSSWLEDVLVGAISEGVNRPTLVVLNIAGVALFIVLVALAILARGYDFFLVFHVVVLILFAVALLGLINW
jgi:uncharacterized membrane protein